MQATIRRLIFPLIALAVCVWLASVAIRWNQYRELARQHESICDDLAAEIEARSRKPDPARSGPKLVVKMFEPGSSLEELKVALAAERRLAMKYRQAASQPWFATPRIGPR